jgi:L-amino acid N-acyltransferase YncA
MLVLHRQWHDPGSVYIVGLGVEPLQQGKGLGTYLLADALNRLGAQGISRASVHVSPANRRALHIYHDRLGFELEAMHYDEFGTGEDRLYLTKHLGESNGRSSVELGGAIRRTASGKTVVPRSNYLPDRIVRLKSALLCHGLRANEFSDDLARWFNPWSAKRTGHVGIHVRLGKTVLNLPMDRLYQNNSIYTNRSPFELRPVSGMGLKDATWAVCDRGGALAAVELIPPPSWYRVATTRGIPMPELLLCEGEANLMGAIPGSCCYDSADLTCRFCAFAGSETPDATPLDYAETVVAALAEDSRITVTLTGGNSRSPDRGLRRYLPYVQAIIKMVEDKLPGCPPPPIQLECAPPEDVSYLRTAIQAGVGSFSVNLEIFDDTRRRAVCPGKSEIPKHDYERAWDFLVGQLGRFRVGSALIFGLEPEYSTVRGALWMLRQGIRPNLIPFKPMPGSAFEEMPPPDFVGYHEVCSVVAPEMLEASLDLSTRLGCTSCGACTLEEDLLREL